MPDYLHARMPDRALLWGSAILVVIGVALIVLAPAKQSVERVSAPGS